MVTNGKKEWERIVLGFEPKMFEKIRKLAFDHKTSFAAVVRACVETGLDKVKKDLEKV